MHPRVRRLPALFVSALCALTLLILAANQAAAVTIDDFSVGPVTVTRNGPTAATSTQTGLDPGHVLGGNRDVIVGEFGASSQSLTIDTALRELSFAAPTGGGYFELDYGSQAQPLNIDLTADGSDAFLVEFAGPGGFVSLNFLRVFTSSGEGVLGGANLGTISTTLPDGRIRMEYPFNAFSGTPDFTAVQRIHLEFFRLSDFSGPVLRNFVTIPEPCALALIIPAALALQQSRSTRRGRRSPKS